MSRTLGLVVAAGVIALVVGMVVGGDRAAHDAPRVDDPSEAGAAPEGRVGAAGEGSATAAGGSKRPEVEARVEVAPHPFEGPAMKVHGRVTSITGEALAGVAVSARVGGEGPAWRTTTAADGTYGLERVPRATLRVEARGPFDTIASRMTRGQGSEEEVSLVLEPGATLIVQAEHARGSVVVSSEGDAETFQDVVYEVVEPASVVAGDDFWADAAPALAEPTRLEPEPEAEEATFERRAQKMMDSLDEDEVGGPLWTLDEALVRALPDYDAEDPVGGIARILETAMQVTPLMGEVFAELAGVEDEGTAPRDLARRLSEQVIADMPTLPTLLTYASARARAGAEGFGAMLDAIEDEGLARMHAEEAARAAREAEWSEVEREMDAQLEALSSRYRGRVFFPMHGRQVNTTGRLGEPLRVRPFTPLTVTVALEETLRGEPLVLHCGVVVLVPGEVREMRCGSGRVTFRGRVVDARGRPIAGARVSTTLADGALEPAPFDGRTQAEGRFELDAEAWMASSCTLTVEAPADAPEAWGPVERRGLACVPGSTVELGVVALWTEPEVAELEREEGHGLGRLLREELGVRWVARDGDATLDALGIPNGSVPLMVDGEDVSTLSGREVRSLLALGEGDAPRSLMMRSPNGDLVEVVTDGRSSRDPGRGRASR